MQKSPRLKSASPAQLAKLAESPDDDLMTGVAGGSYAAFEALYMRHKNAVFRYFIRNVDPESAADAHQETWTRIVANRRRYQPRGRFRAYLFTVAHNVLIDHLRRPVLETGAEPEAQAVGSPESEVSGIEAGLRLRRLIARLPAAQREALVLHKAAGLTIREIARITGVTEEGTKSRLRYAMNKLKRGMRDHV